MAAIIFTQLGRDSEGKLVEAAVEILKQVEARKIV
jgi:hypothetical protein